MPTEEAVGSIENEILDQSSAGEVGNRVLNDMRSIDPVEIIDNTREWTRAHPLAALGIALGTGLLLGIVMRSTVRNESAFEPESSTRVIANTIRKSGNEMVDKVRQASGNVVSEVVSKLSSVESTLSEASAKDSPSFADTLVDGLVASVSRKLSLWLNKS